jgi:hypothetical protein
MTSTRGVAGHRDDHLADGLGLGRHGLAAEVHLVELGDAVDEVRDVDAELAVDVVEAVRGVLDDVVQQRGHERGGVHAQLGQDGGHRERVGDVRVAAAPGLARVCLLGHFVSTHHGAQVCLRVAGPDRARERLEDRRGATGLGGGQPGQASPDPAAGGRAGVVLGPSAGRPSPGPSGGTAVSVSAASGDGSGTLPGRPNSGPR